MQFDAGTRAQGKSRLPGSLKALSRIVDEGKKLGLRKPASKIECGVAVGMPPHFSLFVPTC